MRLHEAIQLIDREDLASQIAAALRTVAPLPRSLTGSANRETLSLLSSALSPEELVQIEVPSGTSVLDWTVPEEWQVREAWVANSNGERIIDVADHPLHLLGYSTPIDAVMSRAELDAHLFSIEELPDAIPYRTSYHSPRWGFCLPHSLRQALPEGDYQVRIDATLAPGSMTYGSAVVHGANDSEMLLTTHLCHPAMWNDNATGLVALTMLGTVLQRAELSHTYRLLFLPGTIGAIAWLDAHRERLDRVIGGFAMTGLGDDRPLQFKRSRRGDSLVDRAAAITIGRGDGSLHAFTPYGYDERQFCSPGFNLGFGRVNRGAHGEYPEYHTSLDNEAFVDPTRVADAVITMLKLLDVIERNDTLINLEPYGEPQLGRRGLYSSLGTIGSKSVEMAYLWVLSCSDGTADLIDITERSGLEFGAVAEAAQRLREAGLVRSSERP